MVWVVLLLLFAASLLIVATGTAGRRPLLSIAVVLALGAGAAAVDAVVRESLPAPSDRPLEVVSGEYVSSRTCRACHPREYATWRHSYHSKMTQLPDPTTVLGRFDGVDLAHDGRRYHLERRGDEYWIGTQGVSASGEPAVAPWRKVVMLTGSHHAQLYWLPDGHSREVGLFAFAWRIVEKKWLPLDTIFLTPPGTHQTLEGGRWSTNCSQCHATQARPRLGLAGTADGSVDTDASEFGISCEACHGPGEQHVRLNSNPVRRYGMRARNESDPSMVQPGRLSSRRASEVCGQCHGVHMFVNDEVKIGWNSDGLKYRPGNELLNVGQRFLLRFGDTLQLPVLKPYFEKNSAFLDQFFWSDGVMRLAGREFNGLMESPCYQRGELSCLSCHQLHQETADTRTPLEWANDQLKPGVDGNRACLDCHKEFEDSAALSAHSRHSPASTGSECMNCHMSYTTYGLLKALRSHTINSPSVAASLATGRPNACNQCHLDQSMGWAADRLAEWYGITRPAMGADEENIAASVLWIVRGDAGQRALMAWSMGWKPAQEACFSTGWMPFYLGQLLGDEYSAVRVLAGRTLSAMPGFDRLDYDATAPPERLRAASEQALATWGRLPVEQRGASDAVLIGRDGRVRMDVAMRLLENRDHRRLHLSE